MDINRIVFKIVSISFSILVALLIVMGLVKLGNYCYDFGYRVFTESPVDAEPGRDVVLQIGADMSEMEIGGLLEEKAAFLCTVKTVCLFRKAQSWSLHLKYFHGCA